MARLLRLCTWVLALVPGLLATVQAECSQDCATCSYRLARPTDINPLVSVTRGRRAGGGHRPQTGPTAAPRVPWSHSGRAAAARAPGNAGVLIVPPNADKVPP